MPAAAIPVAIPVERDGPGCYLNFVANNAGEKSVFFDIANSRIQSWGLPYLVGTWAKIINTPNQNIHAGTKRNFTVYARICGGSVWHNVRFMLKQGTESKYLKVRHDGGNETVSLGNINSFFE